MTVKVQPKENVYVKAYARVRPLSADERKKGAKEIVSCNDSKVVISSGGKDQSFTFDGAFDMQQKHHNIYSRVGEPLVNSLIDGSNAGLIIIGSQSSGKTFLLSGADQEPGLGQMCLQNLYKRVKELGGKKECLITASHMEINEGDTVDLLNPHSKDLNVVNHPRFGIYVDRLSEFVVQSVDELLTLYDQGCKARKSGSSGGRGHRQKSSAIFMVTLRQKSSDQSMGVRSTLYLADLCGVESSMTKDNSVSKNMSALLNVIESLGDGKKKDKLVNYKDSKLTRLLQDALGGNAVTAACVCLSPADSMYQDTMLSIQISQNLRNIKNKVQINTDEGDFVVKELREELGQLREKVMAKSPTKEEVAKYELLVADMQYAKKQAWEEKIKSTAVFEQERRLNLANRGLLEHVLGDDSSRSSTRNVDEKLTKLTKEKDQLANEYKDKRSRVDAMKEELQRKVNEYTKAAEGGRISDSEAKARGAAIHELKEKLRIESEALGKLRIRITEIQDRIAKEKANAASEGLQMIDNMELRRVTEQEARKRQVAEHKAMISEEQDRMRLDVDQAKAELQMNAASGKEHTKEEIFKMATQVAEMTAEKKLVALKIQLLEQEKDGVEKSLTELYQRYKSEMEKLQAANFQTFREYRETFERQKMEIEHRFRSLLEDSVKDAIFLSSRNNELMMENGDLRKEVAKLKDKIVTLEGGKK